MRQTPIVIAFLAMFIISSAFLFWQNARELDPNTGKNWWALSFSVLDDDTSLVFRIENHSDLSSFHYEVLVGKKHVRLAEDSFSLNRGETIEIHPNIDQLPDGRVSIIVTSGNEKKEIYR